MRGNPTPELFDYIACKFILSLPKQQLYQDRIGFHFQKAYFYYLDTHGLPAPTYSKNKADKFRQPKQIVNFCNQLLRVVSCPQMPRLTGNQISLLIEQNYCTIPVSGIIILNQPQTHVVLVESRDYGVFGFPKGKINECQSYQQCAIREVKEQIGLKLEVDSNYYVEIEQFSKCGNKSLAKKCRFFICKVQESCLVQRKGQSDQKQKGFRSILHSNSQIKSISWIKLGEMSKLIDKQLVNTPSRLAYFQLMKKINKNLSYKQKKTTNPLEEFKGFDKNLGLIFLK